MDTPEPQPVWIVIGRDDPGIVAVSFDADRVELGRRSLGDDPADWVATQEERFSPRWVWGDTVHWYPELLARGVRVARCRDLRLAHAILRHSPLVGESSRGPDPAWDAVAAIEGAGAPALFDMLEQPGVPQRVDAAVAELDRQERAVDAAKDPGRLRVLLAAESAGALLAAELRVAGLPWDPEVHDRLLADVLGPRPADGAQPEELRRAAARVREALGDATVRLDSQPKLLRALHRAGLLVESTSRWELARHDHPAVGPLVEYKRLYRLLSANGWHWLDEWIRDGRFRPVYVPAGVITGRWASSGGGALQIPRSLRPAVRADPGWRLVVADVAQLEPRVLAAMASDRGLAEAARGRDLYAGLVDSGVVGSRSEAKLALLGAMYGATTGDSAKLLPRLRRAFPRAMALVDDAARVGEDGGQVSTWLGRGSPPASDDWSAAQRRAGEFEASASDETRARRSARDRGRFTRNYIVQGTAAEWAMAWLGDLRARLSALAEVGADEAAPRSGPAFATRAHLAFFLHDEIIVHTPAARAEQVAVAVQDSATAAGRLLFGDFPIDFPLELRISDAATK